jgi:hypothetical protein
MIFDQDENCGVIFVPIDITDKENTKLVYEVDSQLSSYNWGDNIKIIIDKTSDISRENKIHEIKKAYTKLANDGLMACLHLHGFVEQSKKIYGIAYGAYDVSKEGGIVFNISFTDQAYRKAIATSMTKYTKCIAETLFEIAHQ